MLKLHEYATHLTWTGNRGSGTMDYRSYDRDYTLSINDKPDILGSSDAQFLGNKHRHNPEDLLVASLSSCHMLWYLHLCSKHDIVVIEYRDAATGKMEEGPDGSGRFVEVTLRPEVRISAASKKEKAQALHAEANRMCFIANSCNFPVKHEAVCTAEDE
ncbi:peroxiredoxin [Pedobacter yulinensis]|uniref:Peroxiredoxin n=1 Tax=Pedobacter yulinensis TaxID=2126353 RepID=A0A2T3HP48_9SPHI|nr:OsmC family protein [Pedobacter yulinensis]PST84228.1 peroxiredoxin [Pedobacter yulinensis]